MSDLFEAAGVAFAAGLEFVSPSEDSSTTTREALFWKQKGLFAHNRA